MNIIEVAYKWNGGFAQRNRTDYITLHHAEAVKCTPADIHSWHLSNGWTGIGYHFFVRKDGTIYRGRPLNVVGAHVSGMNNCSIGICAEGDYHSKNKTMPQAQFNAIVELCKYLKTNYYPNAKIVGHREIGSSNCPGQYYPLNNIKQAVATNTVITESEELTMTQYEELKQTKQDKPMVYDYMDANMPDWAKPTIQKLMNKGALVGNDGKLGLTMDMIKVFCVNDRMGLYD